MTRLIASLVVALLLPLTAAGQAHARPDPGGTTEQRRSSPHHDPVGICAGQSKDHIHKWFKARPFNVPIRCGTWSGTKGFGVRKLVAQGRWNTWHKDMIAITLANPRHIERKGTTWVYRTREFVECNPSYHYRVVVQMRNVGGTKRMRGIITAYQRFET